MEKVTVVPNVVRLDVKPAIVEVEGLDQHGVHFELPTGQSFTLSIVAMKNIINASEHWNSAVLVQVSPRDRRLINKGVVFADQYPLEQTE